MVTGIGSKQVSYLFFCKFLFNETRKAMKQGPCSFCGRHRFQYLVRQVLMKGIGLVCWIHYICIQCV